LKSSMNSQNLANNRGYKPCNKRISLPKSYRADLFYNCIFKVNSFFTESIHTSRSLLYVNHPHVQT
jgi:hypothetical protein